LLIDKLIIEYLTYHKWSKNSRKTTKDILAKMSG